MLKKLPERVKIFEVGPRDGLQNEEISVPTEAKIAMIDLLSATGLTNIEITSFVRPEWTPQLADSELVSTGINKKKGINYTALLPNVKGLERAGKSGLEEIAVFMSASQSHNKKNLNRTIEESLEIIQEVKKKSTEYGIKRVRAYLSTVFGCPYEGRINKKNVSKITRKLLDLGIYQVSLGDTIGIANPRQVEEVLESLFLVIEDQEQLALHFHDTRGMAIANSLVGLSMGVTTFDSSIGGLGGCPYAPGATGNVATEDLVNMFQSMGVETGINLEKLVECNNYLKKILGRELSSKFSQTFNSTKRVPV